MSYPLSADVSAGDPTQAAHYNNLRSDALRLGQLAADGVNLGSLLECFESKLTIQRLSTNKIRVPATALLPVDLVIAGVPLRSVANVDLAAGDVPTGGAQTWYIFANRTAGSTTFTLSINTSATEGVNQRLIGQFYFDGTNIVKDSIQTQLGLLIAGLLYNKEPHQVQGRLTLSTGIAVPYADVTSSATLFFTPYNGNRVSLYVAGYGWRVYSFAELSLDISGFTTGKNYDIFLYDNAGTLTLEGLIWSNDTLRATAIVLQDGRWVKSGSLDRLYLGTIRTSGSGVTCDTKLKRFVWNCFNRVSHQLVINETVGQWTYAVNATYRRWNNNAANQVEFVIGIQEIPIFLHFMANIWCAGAYNASIGIGLDRTNACDANVYSSIGGNGFIGNSHCEFNDFVGLGYHYLALLEWVYGCTATFSGKMNPANDVYNTGATGHIFA